MFKVRREIVRFLLLIMMKGCKLPMKRTTVREQFLTDSAYKIVTYLLIIGLGIILVLSWIKMKDVNYWIIGIYFLILGDWICTFLQKRSWNVILSIILGGILSFVIGILFLLYNALIK